MYKKNKDGFYEVPLLHLFYLLMCLLLLLDRPRSRNK